MAAPVLQFKRGLLANLPGLRAGEPGFTTDSYDLYVGLTSETSTNKFFGSHRYWSKETTSTGSGLNLVEGTSNGSDYITLKSPDSLSGIVTYTFPGTDGTNGQVLATNGSGTLSFINAAANLDIAGDTGTDTVALLTDTLTFAGTANEIETAVTNNQIQIGLPDNVVVGGGLTATTFTLAGVAVTAILDEDAMTSDRSDALATQQSIKAYVDNTVGAVDLTIDTAAGTNGDSGTGSVSTSQTLTFNGTTNEIDVSVSGQSVTYGLPNDVTIGNNLTVTGNLYVNGSTTQVNTSSLTIEDRTIELGLVDGSAPSSATTWDLGVLFNYHSTSAKKSAVVWEQGDARFKFASEVSDGGGTDNDSPQITFTAYAPIEIGALWVNDCAGSSQVISCTGTERFLENITIDAGIF